MMHEADDRLNNLEGKISLQDIAVWFVSPDREILPDHVERAITILLNITYGRSVRSQIGSEEERITEAMYDFEKHFRCLVRTLKTKHKNAFDLMPLIGCGSTVAHRIWARYGGNEEPPKGVPVRMEPEYVTIKTCYVPCPQCGEDIAHRQTFCGSCGHVFNSDVKP